LELVGLVVARKPNCYHSVKMVTNSHLLAYSGVFQFFRGGV